MPSRFIDSFATTPALADRFSDDAVLGAMLRFEAALAHAQARLGMIPQAAADAIASVDRLDPASMTEAPGIRHASDSFCRGAEKRVGQIDSDAAGFVHWGATSQDLLDTAWIPLMRDALPVLIQDHDRLERSLRAFPIATPYGHAGAYIASAALPTTFGYKVAGRFARFIGAGGDCRRSSTRRCSFSSAARRVRCSFTDNRGSAC